MSASNTGRGWGLGVCLVVLVAAAARAQAPASQPADFDAVLAAARPRALELVLAAAQSDDVALRAHALEAAHWLPERAAPLLGPGLDDPSPVVRFVAAVTIGKLQLRQMAPAIQQRLAQEQAQAQRWDRLIEEQRLYASADQLHLSEANASAVRSAWAADLFALRRCGQEPDLSPLAAMLTHEDGRLRGNVVMLLGLLGDRSAVALLQDRVRLALPRDQAVNKALLNLQYAEALVRLGQTSYLQAVRAAIFSPFPEVRVLALCLVGDLDDRTQVGALVNLLTDKNVETMEVRLAAAGALAQLGDRRGSEVILACAGSGEPRLRGFAAKALGALRDPAAGVALAGLLRDPDPQVRLAAAAAVFQAGAADRAPAP
jgi:HEAT repeat protein